MNNLEEFCEAVISGNKEKILDLFTECFDASTTEGTDNKLLHLALMNIEELKKFNQTKLIDILKIFLNRGFDINVKNILGKTFLHLAVEHRMKDVIDFCISQNTDLNASDSNGNTLAHFTIEEECKKLNSISAHEDLENESSKFVDWMISRGIDFFHNRNMNNQSPLYLANELNSHRILLTLLKHVTDFSPVEKNQTPLLCAFLYRNIIKTPDTNFGIGLPQPLPSHHTCLKSRHTSDIVKIIMEKNKSMNDRTLTLALRTAIWSDQDMVIVEMILECITKLYPYCEDGESLIQTFTNKFANIKKDKLKREPYMKVLKMLIHNGSNINECDFHGETMALKLFSCQLNFNMLKILNEGRAIFRASNCLGDNFLHLLSRRSNDIRMIDIVVKSKCDVDSINMLGKTPLLEALAMDRYEIAKRLIDLGANVNVTDKFGMSPLSLACNKGHLEAAKMLIENGANLNYRDSFGNTLLHLTIKYPKFVDLLVKYSADVNATNNFNMTPLSYAASGYSFNTVAELINYGADAGDPIIFKCFSEDFQKYITVDSSMLRRLEKNVVQFIGGGLYEQIKKAHHEPTIKWILQIFFERCEIEIESLKIYSIDNRTSLYQLLHKNRNRRCAYIDNEKLKSIVEDPAIQGKFPNYYVLIIGCYNEIMTRKSLLQPATNACYKFTDFDLPDLSVI